MMQDAPPLFDIDILSATPAALIRWAALAAESDGTVFQTRAFLEAAVTRWHDLQILFLKQDGQDIAALHFRPEHHRGLRILRHPGIAECDYAGPILRRDVAPEILQSAWPQIVAALPRHDLLILKQMPGPEIHAPLDVPALGGVQRIHTHAHPRPLPPGTDPLDLLPKAKLRSDLRRRKRKLEAQGALTFRVAKGDEIAPLFETLTDWRIARFTAIGKNDPLRDPAQRHLYLSLAQNHPETAQICGLFLNDHPIALQYGLLTPDRYCQILTAFEDGPHKVNAPARLLMIEAMRWCQDRGITTYDFTVGDEPYKDDFGTDALPVREALLPRTLPGHAYARAKQVEFAAESWWEARQAHR
ncbi:MAG: GNAT family N-acetyltransferase [Rhodobacteraceae bacterium]|nr:GNAT family N-acetyltransferase [Paracoccaceae bacterium]